jgi:hypothetical protein
MTKRLVDTIRELSDYVSLLYHEARNIRHLISDGHVKKEGWEKIVSLPRNRDKAWRIIQPFRISAKQAASASECLHVFEQRFDKDIEALQKMFNAPNWKHAKFYGGNAWAHIAGTVSDLVQAINSGRTPEMDVALDDLRKAEHNTGSVESKLHELDANLG